MEPLAAQWPLLLAMVLLMAASGFFSCSEAALFSLTRSLRDAMRRGTDAERFAESLLDQPDRLLTAILFWNLLINMAYFALSSVVSIRLGADEQASGWLSQGFALASLLAIIVASELAPKNVGVLNPQRMAALLGVPLGVATGVLDPILPALRTVSNASARLLLPNFQSEPYLGIDDVERAVDLGAGDTHDNETLRLRERQVLHRLVDLASATAEELMQPRRRLVVAPPDTQIDDLSTITGDYLFVTEPHSDEIAGAVWVSLLPFADSRRLKHSAEPVAYTPWCASAADTFNLLRREGRRVAAVLNELGETIGVVTIERLLDSVLRDVAREDPDDIHAPRLRLLPSGGWEASAATPLRRLAKRVRLHHRPDETVWFAAADVIEGMRSVTVGGLLQESLQRPPVVGDAIRLAGLQWTVIAGPAAQDSSVPDGAPLLVKISLDLENSDTPTTGQGGTP